MLAEAARSRGSISPKRFRCIRTYRGLQCNTLLIDFADGTERANTSEERFERLVELPPSAKLVYKVLEAEGQLTQSRLADETLLPKRTVRYALTQLEAADVVEADIYIPDARKKLYRPKPVAQPG